MIGWLNQQKTPFVDQEGSGHFDLQLLPGCQDAKSEMYTQQFWDFTFSLFYTTQYI